MSRSRIVVLGGAHMDKRGRVTGKAIPGASNPGTWLEEPGGGAFNAASNLASLGHEVTMIAPRGGDGEGGRVTKAVHRAGIIDRPVIFLDRRTPSYTAILERDGNLVIAIADMDLYRIFTPRRLKVRAVREALESAQFVLTDANLPAETLAALAKITTELKIPLFGIAISPAKVVRFKPALAGLSCLFMNEIEAMALTGKRVNKATEWPDCLRRLGLTSGVITRGKLGAIAFDATMIAVLTPVPVEDLRDVTGAGDGLAAGFMDALIAGASLPDALKRGTALAAITLRSERATAQSLSSFMLDHENELVPPAQILS